MLRQSATFFLRPTLFRTLGFEGASQDVFHVGISAGGEPLIDQKFEIRRKRNLHDLIIPFPGLAKRDGIVVPDRAYAARSTRMM